MVDKLGKVISPLEKSMKNLEGTVADTIKKNDLKMENLSD